MTNFIDNLRKKDEATRKRYVVGIALVITLLIAAGWVTMLGTRGFSTEEVAQGQEATAEVAKPLNIIGDTFSDIFGDFSDKWKNRPRREDIIVPAEEGSEIFVSDPSEVQVIEVIENEPEIPLQNEAEFGVTEVQK